MNKTKKDVIIKAGDVVKSSRNNMIYEVFEVNGDTAKCLCLKDDYTYTIPVEDLEEIKDEFL